MRIYHDWSALPMPRLFVSAICMSLVLCGVHAGDAQAQQYRSNTSRTAKYVVPQSGRFEGSYYVSNGKHYFRSASTRYSRPQVVNRGSNAHVGDLIRRLEYETRLLCLDMADNYSHNREYAHTYQNAFELWEHTVEIKQHYQSSNRATMTAMVRELDSLFQPVRRDVIGWSRHQKKQRGEGGIYTKIDRTESLIHHLNNDVGPTSRGPKLVSAGSSRREPTPAH
jgi:hypothetical protein